MGKGKGLVSKASELVRHRPKSTLKIYSDKEPGVKDYKVGDTITFTVTAKVKSIYEGDSAYVSEYDYDDDDSPRNKTLCATLQVQSIKEK